jgi:hypothetical protein
MGRDAGSHSVDRIVGLIFVLFRILDVWSDGARPICESLRLSGGKENYTETFQG